VEKKKKIGIFILGGFSTLKEWARFNALKFLVLFLCLKEMLGVMLLLSVSF
jgi:hypothetical protein